MTSRLSENKPVCKHPWTSLRRTLGGIICTACRWRGDTDGALGAAFSSAKSVIDDQDRRLRMIEQALSLDLDLSCCEECGRWGRPGPGFVILEPGEAFDVYCLHRRLPDLISFPEEDEDLANHLRRQRLRDLARWFIRLGAWTGPAAKRLDLNAQHPEIYRRLLRIAPEIDQVIAEERQSIEPDADARECGHCRLPYWSPLPGDLCPTCAEDLRAYLSEDLPARAPAPSSPDPA